MKRKWTIDELRTLVCELIQPTIDMHRGSRTSVEGPAYLQPEGNPTEDEIDDFLIHNPLIEDTTRNALTDQQLYGFAVAQLDDEGVDEFKSAIVSWANSNSWLAADMPWLVLAPSSSILSTERTEKPTEQEVHSLLISSSVLDRALDLIQSGKELSELNPRDFERLIAELLESQGWEVNLSKQTRDGGVDIRAFKHCDTVGPVCAIWQAKRYRSENAVRIHQVRELAAVRDRELATKAIIVTTSRLTRDAIEWINRDKYRLGFKQREDVTEWIRRCSRG